MAAVLSFRALETFPTGSKLPKYYSTISYHVILAWVTLHLIDQKTFIEFFWYTVL